MRWRLQSLVFLFLTFTISLVKAQDKNISGTVVGEDEVPIPGGFCHDQGDRCRG